MSFRHHLALFKDHSCLLLPTIARHCPRLPAKKMSQAVVASQYGRGSRGPGRVPRAAPRQPGCTAEQTNHEPRSFLARGASRREFRGFHESRNTAFPRAPREPARNPRFSRKTKNKKLKTGFEVFTNHESRNTNHGFFSPWGRQGGATGNRRPDHCARRQVTVSRFTVVHYCSRWFAIVHEKILFGASVPAPPGRCFAGRVRAAWRGFERLSRGMRGGGGVGGETVSLPRRPFSVGLARSVAAGQFPLRRAQNEPMLGKGCVPDSIGAKPDSTSAGMGSIITGGTCRLCYD